VTATVALLLVAPAVAAAPTFKVSLTAATHTPVADNTTRWPYQVKVTDLKGKALAGRVTIEIVDPYGGVHPVEFGANTRLVKNWPFKGVFRDWVLWPPEAGVAGAAGVVLNFRATVTTAKGKAVRIYAVKPHP
jgi:hypothetical protein